MFSKGRIKRKTVWNILIIILFCSIIHLCFNWSDPVNTCTNITGVFNGDTLLVKNHSCGVNNPECERLLRTFHTWPEGKPRAAIYILTQASRNQTLRKTLESIDANFNNCFNYPIIIFHERDLRSLIPWIRKISKSDLYFQEVEFNMPHFIPAKSEWPKSGCKASDGYKHMCRFHAKLIYEMPIIQNLEYYWRLDDDSLLLDPITYDVFQYMRTHNLHYGYRIIFYDKPDCVLGLWEAAKQHMETNKIEPTFFNSWPELQIYYNNFEISKVSVWTQQKYKEYIDNIDKNGGIYYHRWGDAPIKSIAVTMFVPPSKVHYFGDTGYKHQSFTVRPLSRIIMNAILHFSRRIKVWMGI